MPMGAEPGMSIMSRDILTFVVLFGSCFAVTSAQCTSGQPLTLQAEVHNVHNFTSPNYPDQYPGNSHCRWTVTAPNASYVVRLESIHFDLEVSTGCTYDSVSFYDGFSSQAPLLKTQCSGPAFFTVYSPGPRMFVEFRSDGSSHGQGFVFSYQAYPRTLSSTSTATPPYAVYSTTARPWNHWHTTWTAGPRWQTTTTTTTNRPRSATRGPYYNTNRPWRTTRGPYYNTNRPYRNTNRPYRTTRGPYYNTNRPYHNTNRPWRTTRGPYYNTNRPYRNTNRPYRTTREPYYYTNRPYRTTRGPYYYTNRPYRTTNRPWRTTTGSYYYTNRPYRNTNRPWDATRRPNYNTNRPYYNTNRPRHSTNRRYYYTNRPQSTTPRSPYYNNGPWYNATRSPYYNNGPWYNATRSPYYNNGPRYNATRSPYYNNGPWYNATRSPYYNNGPRYNATRSPYYNNGPRYNATRPPYYNNGPWYNATRPPYYNNGSRYNATRSPYYNNGPRYNATRPPYYNNGPMFPFTTAHNHTDCLSTRRRPNYPHRPWTTTGRPPYRHYHTATMTTASRPYHRPGNTNTSATIKCYDKADSMDVLYATGKRRLLEFPCRSNHDPRICHRRWLILARPQQQLWLVSKKVRLGRRPHDFVHSNLTIYGGNSTQAPVLMRTCGQNVAVTNGGSALLLVLHTDGTNPDIAFNIWYGAKGRAPDQPNRNPTTTVPLVRADRGDGEPQTRSPPPTTTTANLKADKSHHQEHSSPHPTNSYLKPMVVMCGVIGSVFVLAVVFFIVWYLHTKKKVAPKIYDVHFRPDNGNPSSGVGIVTISPNTCNPPSYTPPLPQNDCRGVPFGQQAYCPANTFPACLSEVVMYNAMTRDSAGPGPQGSPAQGHMAVGTGIASDTPLLDPVHNACHKPDPVPDSPADLVHKTCNSLPEAEEGVGKEKDVQQDVHNDQGVTD